MGRAVGPARRRPVRPLAARARREQRRRRDAVGRPRPDHPRHRVLRGRDGRPALHHACAASSPTPASSTSSPSGWSRPTRRLPIGNPLARARWSARSSTTRPSRRCRTRWRQASERGRHARRRGRPPARGRRRRTPTTPSPRSCASPEQTDVVPRGDLRPDPLRAALRRPRRGDRAEQRRPAGPLVEHLHLATRPRPSGSSPPRAPTAASSTSTSARPAPRSAAPSAARRRPAAAASPARTPGAPTCAGRPTPSTTPASCRSPRASTSRSSEASARVAGEGRSDLVGEQDRDAELFLRRPDDLAGGRSGRSARGRRPRGGR